MPHSRRRPSFALLIGAGILAAGLLATFGILYWFDAAVGDPDPIARLGGTVRRESAPYEGVNRLIDRVLPGFSPRTDGFSRDVIVGVDLSNTDADNVTLRSLGRMDHLQELDLSATRIDDAGLAHLQELRRLRSLMLARTGITDAGLKELALIRSLIVLNLIDTDISDAGLAELNALSLVVLHLGHNPGVTDEGIRRLVKAVPELTIQLYECDVDDRIVKRRGFRLSESGVCTDCVEFLGRYSATDRDLSELAAYHDLLELSLAGSRVSDAGLEHLHSLKKLAWVDLTDTQVTADGIEALKQAFPQLKVVRE
jgi:hypothetical protein